jgi:GT2 family glycosyltransferase
MRTDPAAMASAATWIAGAEAPPGDRYDADIVILALDRAEETLAAIRSALAQTSVSTHLFVLDQGSRPETLDRFATALTGQRGATLLSSATNLGVAAGRNLVSALGHGRVIVALDNDAEFAAPDTVARMVAALDAEPRLAAVGCRIVAFDTGADDLSSWGYPPGLLSCAGESFDAVTFVGAGHAIRRAAWVDAGGYDGKLFFCWEEFDFCLRAIALGWRVRYRGDIVIRHKVSGERRVGWSGDRWFYFVRNRLYISRKLGERWPALAPRVCGYLVKSLRHGLAAETIRAIVAADGMLPNRRGAAIPLPARLYIARNDLLHRGSLLRRVRKEVLSRLATAAAPAAE